MPTYDYRCAECGYEFEKFQSMSASVLRKCPQCGKMTLKRLIGTGAGVIFKGSGFYETDYRSESYKSSVKSETSTRKETKKETKTEQKPQPTAATGEKKTAKAKDEKNKKI